MRQTPRKRRFPRVPLIAPVVVRRLGDNASEITRTRTLGLGGCMFESDKGWGVGASLALGPAAAGALDSLRRKSFQRLSSTENSSADPPTCSLAPSRRSPPGFKL